MQNFTITNLKTPVTPVHFLRFVKPKTEALLVATAAQNYTKTPYVVFFPFYLIQLTTQ